MSWRSISTKCQWIEESTMKNHCAKMRLKEISKVFCPSKDDWEVVDRRKCTPLISIRAMLCIKQMLKIHCNNRTLCGANLPQMSSQNSFYYYSEICYLFFYCMVFLSMYTFLYFLCAFLWDSVLLFVYFSLSLWGFFKLVFNFMHFCFSGQSEKQLLRQ